MTNEERNSVGTKIIDLRSDTVTLPSQEMREAMASAMVGDDVYGEDPSVNALEQRVASLLHKEAAVFFPTGTQSNLAAILSHCGRGTELLVGSSYHIRSSEAGGASVLGGIVMTPLPVSDCGSLDPKSICAGLRPDSPNFPATRLLCLENTVSGRAVSLESLQDVTAVARRAGLAIHLDGARLFNAATELKVPASEIADLADTVSICLSKGLGTPAGTMLTGPRSMEKIMRRNRKILGGGMRQAGILAAAGIFALNQNIERLADDHRRAKQLAEWLQNIPSHHGLHIRHATNMVFISPKQEQHDRLHGFLKKRNIFIGNQIPAMRLVLHLGIDDEDVRIVGSAIQDFYKGEFAVN